MFQTWEWQTDKPLLTSPPQPSRFCFSVLPSFVWIPHIPGHWAEEKSHLVTMSAPRERPSALTCRGERGKHTLLFGYQSTHYKQERWGGGRGGEEGAGEEESLAFRGFSPTARCTHNAVSFVRISQPRIVHSPGGCEKHCARRSNHALPATVRQQQASSTAHGPREWRDMLTASSEVSLPSW